MRQSEEGILGASHTRGQPIWHGLTRFVLATSCANCLGTSGGLFRTTRASTCHYPRPTGAARSRAHTPKGTRLYSYYVSQEVLKRAGRVPDRASAGGGDRGGD